MPAKRIFINSETNKHKWLLGESLGHSFENHIYDFLCEALSSLNVEDYDIIKTPGSNDYGKDIIIKSRVDLHNLLMTNFYLHENPEITIYIECKSSNNYNVSHDQILGKFQKVKNSNLQYFVLITNYTIVPHTYYQLQQECKANNITFVLIDQHKLYKSFKDNDFMIGDIKDYNLNEDIYIEYQVFNYEHLEKYDYEIFLLLRNYKNSTEKIDINLITNRNWYTAHSDNSIYLDAYQYTAVSIKALHKYQDGINNLSFLIKSSASETVMDVEGIKSSTEFIPDLSGQAHRETIDFLFDSLTQKKLSKFFYLFGNAGIGKTRIIDELCKKLEWKPIAVKRIICTKNNIKVKEQLLEFLVKEGVLDNSNANKSLYCNLKENLKKKKTCLVILDDIHNLFELITEVKELYEAKLNHNIYFVLIGRDDYSAGSIEYFNFTYWCRDRMDGKIIGSLKDHECLALIQSIIQDIPSVALEKIHKASQNIPLYITQYIEYLLEIKLIHIINRNTLGIHNIATFATKLYIPNGIEAIYAERCKNLSEYYTEYMEFLYVCALIGIKIPKNAALSYFNNDWEAIKVLKKRKFLFYDDLDKDTEDDIRFIHESLYLYLRKALHNNKRLSGKIASVIIQRPYLLNLLSSFEKGRVYYLAGQINLAREPFKPIIEFCKNIKNYTAFNLNLEYYEYLDIVYQLLKNNTDLSLIKNLFILKIHTTLHYYTPVRAIEECIHTENEITKNKNLHTDADFLTTIKTLKCHSYVNAGQLKNAEHCYNQLIAEYMLTNTNFNTKSTMDMFDRLSGLYIRYNSYQLAEKYNTLSFQIANTAQDDNLLGLAFITQGKLNFYCAPEKSYQYLLQAKNSLERGAAKRNILHNNITIAAYEVFYIQNSTAEMKDLEKKATSYLQESIDEKYPSLIIRTYLLMAIIDFYLEGSCSRYSSTEKHLEKGINASLQYGLPTYIWMFYNLKLIISIKLHKDTDYIMKIAETNFRLLKQQDLLFLGNLNFCYGNVPALSNILHIFSKYMSERSFYKKASNITWYNFRATCDFDCDNNKCNYVCEKDIHKLKKEYEKAKKNELLFIDGHYKIKDQETGLYIIFA